MTQVFCCSFSCGVINAQSHWSAGAGTPTIITTGALHGDRSLECVSAAAATWAQSVATVSGSGILVARAYVRFPTSLPDGNVQVFGALTGGTFSGVRFDVASAELRIASAVAGVAIVANTTYRLDVYINSTANPWTTDAQVNGVALTQGTQANAADTTAKTISIGLRQAITGTAIYDSVAVSVTSGDYPLGEGHGLGFVPTSDGTHNIAGTNDFERGDTGTDLLNATTNAYLLIDDVPLPTGAVNEADCWRAVAPPNSTDYPESIFGPIGSSAPSAPQSVEAICIHHQIATTNGSFDVLLNDNGTTGTIVTASGAAGVTTYRVGRAHFALAPTGGAWTITAGAGNFNNARVRFRSADALPDQCLDAVMLEADFAGLPVASIVPILMAQYRQRRA